MSPNPTFFFSYYVRSYNFFFLSVTFQYSFLHVTALSFSHFTSPLNILSLMSQLFLFVKFSSIKFSHTHHMTQRHLAGTITLRYSSAYLLIGSRWINEARSIRYEARGREGWSELIYRSTANQSDNVLSSPPKHFQRQIIENVLAFPPPRLLNLPCASTSGKRGKWPNITLNNLLVTVFVTLRKLHLRLDLERHV